MRTGGGADEPGAQTAYGLPLSCGENEPHGSGAACASACAKHGAGDRPDRPGTECRQCSTTAGIIDASADSCGPCFECSATDWLIRQNRSCGTNARPSVDAPDCACGRSPECSSGTCSCDARDLSNFDTSVSVWHAGVRIQDDCTAWAEFQTGRSHGTAV